MEQNGTQESTQLTDRQLVALPYIVASASLSEGAHLANIGRTTLYRWMDDPEFRASLERLRSQAADLARTELQGLMLKAILALAEAMEDPDANTRLRAARATLYIGLKSIDIKELQERVDRLDDAFNLWATRNPRP